MCSQILEDGESKDKGGGSGKRPVENTKAESEKAATRKNKHKKVRKMNIVFDRKLKLKSL